MSYLFKENEKNYDNKIDSTESNWIRTSTSPNMNRVVSILGYDPELWWYEEAVMLESGIAPLAIPSGEEHSELK